MVLDLKKAYEQIRIVPEHVEWSAITTPDGNMVSQVIQIGDCNAPATHQALMNNLFSSYVGQFMDIYLDDIVIYSNCLEDHIKHVKLVLNVLCKEKLYLSVHKLRFIMPELKLLGCVVDNEGIHMDAAKVDSVMAWKVPTNWDLLRDYHGFWVGLGIVMGLQTCMGHGYGSLRVWVQVVDSHPQKNPHPQHGFVRV